MKHGGSRKGSGRKKLLKNLKMKPLMISMHQQQIDEVNAYCTSKHYKKSEFIRQAIINAIINKMTICSI